MCPTHLSIASGSGYTQSVLRDGPMAYWRLEEASGTSLADSSGNTHTVTMPNSTGVTYHSASQLADGSFGLTFGSTQTACSTLTGIATTTTASFEFWLNVVTPNGDGYNTIILQDSNNGIFTFSTGGGHYKVDVYYSGDHLSSTNLSYGTPYHVVISIAAGAGTFYVNGVTNGTFSTYPGWTVDALFGASAVSNNNILRGFIDEVAIYPSALSAQQVATHYTLRNGCIRGKI